MSNVPIGKIDDQDVLRGKVVNPEKIYGKSAYEIAVMHGFDGTEEEWLESLNGKNGDPFTYEDFTPEQLESLHGKDGKDGVGVIDVVQGTGNNDNKVMSQKAVTELVSYDVDLEEDITDSLTLNVGYFWAKTLKMLQGTSVNTCTDIIPVQEGEQFKISSKYGYYTVLVAEFDANGTMVSYNGEASADTVAVDYEYTVPSGVYGIAVSTRENKYNPIVVKKLVKDDVKRHIANIESKLEKSSADQFVKNGIVNGNFATTDGWSAVGGSLSVAENIGIVTTDKSNNLVMINASFGEYEAGDKVFFKASIKAPFGKGGSVAQNDVLIHIYNNSSTGMKYAVRNKKLQDIEWNDSYGIIDFDGAYSTAKTYFVAEYNKAQFIPDGAKVRFRNMVAVNLTKAYGSGNEPTADDFYALLGGFENKWFDGEENLFSAKAEANRILADSILDHDITVTVGDGGDFLTLNGAIGYLSHFYPVYKKGGIKCYVKILAGTVINEQIYANQIDLQYITIIAEASADHTETINIDDTAHTFAIVDVDATGFGNTANAHDARGNYPFIAGENAAKLPTIGCVFRLLTNTVESGKTVCGMLCNRGSEGVVLAASGFDGFNDGVISNNESSITIREGISRNMTRLGVHARHNGEVSARSCICTNCGVGACADRIGDLDVREATLNGSKVAIECNNISRANANGCHAQNCGAAGDYVVKVSGGGMANCGSFDANGYVGTLYNVTVNTLTANGIIFA